MINIKYSVMQQDRRQPRCNVRLHSIAKYISRRHHFQNLLVITLSLMHFFWLHVVVVVVVVIGLFPATFIFNYPILIVSYFSFVSILISALVWKLIALEFVAQRV